MDNNVFKSPFGTIAMMQRELFYVSFISILWIYPEVKGIIDGSKLAEELRNIKREIGVDHMQGVFNNLPYSTKEESGKQLQEKIQNSLNQSLSDLDTVLKNVKGIVTGQSEGTSTSLPSCCTLADSQLEYKAAFRGKVDITTACFTETSIPATNVMYPPDAVSDKMKKNYNNNKNVLWQRYSTTHGISMIYPATKPNNCASFDPRFSSSYAAAAYPKDKDVVILLDTSSLMGAPSGVPNKPKIVLSREAVNNVIQTLTPNDRVGIVAFASDIKTPQDCYSSELSFASKTNVDKLKEFIFSVRTSESVDSNFEKALNKAFQYFVSINGTADFENREQIILFITAGSHTIGGPPVQVISEENAKFDNKIRIFANYLGQDSTTITTLKNMAGSAGHFEVFNFTRLTKEELSPVLATFYLHLPKEQVDFPSFSVPYVDPYSGKGLITSLCIPVEDSSLLRGVVCTDVKVGELLSEVEFFSEDEYSYAFIIDGTGRVLMHPLLPNTVFVTNTPVLVDVSVLEHAPTPADIEMVIESMKKGGTGTKNLQKYFIKPRGKLVNDGSVNTIQNATLYWGPVPRSNFSLCVVIVDQSSKIDESKFKTSDMDLNKVFMYHNRTLVKNSYDECKFYKRTVTLDSSCVKFSQSAFQNPFEYLDRTETAIEVAGYTEYFTKPSASNKEFKTTVRPSIWATYKAEEFWKKNLARHVSWRYMATKAGFVRIYPGVLLQKSYDHEKRIWWRLALSHAGKSILTTPYVDAWGSGIVLSVIHTIYKKGTTTVTATVGADVPLEYFNWFMNSVYPDCKESKYRCMIVDDSGFIVLHPRLQATTSEDDFKEPKHITVEEPVIAKQMIAESLMTSENECQDLSENKIMRSFRVAMRAGSASGLSFGKPAGVFEISPVADTNVFVLKAAISGIGEPKCECDDTKSPDVVVCSDTCNCLCHKMIQYDVCSNSYTKTSTLPCSSRIPDTSGVSEPDDTTGLKQCFKATCADKQTQTACYSERECSWCEYTSESLLIKTPCCRLKEECTFGKAKAEYSNTCDFTPTESPKDEKSTGDSLTVGERTAAIAGACLAAGVLLTIISIGIIKYCKHRRSYQDQADPYLSAIPGEELKDYCHTGPQEQFDEPMDEVRPGIHQTAEPNAYFNPGSHSTT